MPILRTQRRLLLFAFPTPTRGFFLFRTWTPTFHHGTRASSKATRRSSFIDARPSHAEHYQWGCIEFLLGIWVEAVQSQSPTTGRTPPYFLISKSHSSSLPDFSQGVQERTNRSRGVGANAWGKDIIQIVSNNESDFGQTSNRNLYRRQRNPDHVLYVRQLNQLIADRLQRITMHKSPPFLPWHRIWLLAYSTLASVMHCFDTI